VLKAGCGPSDGRGVSLRGAPTRLTQLLVPLVLAALLALAASGAGRQSAAAAVGDCTPGSGWGTVRSDLAAQVVGLVNQHRAGLGLGGLAESATLRAAAVWKAQHMAAYGYFAHDDPAPPVARSVWQRLAACGYSAGGGENIAYGYPSASAVMQGWLSSPGHKANIERSSFRATGVGVATAANGTVYWVQTFGSVADSGSPPPAPPPPAPPPPAASPPPAPTPPSAAKQTAAAKPPVIASKPQTQAPKPATAPSPAGPAAAAKPGPTSKPQQLPQLEASRLLQWGGRPQAGRMFTGRLTISVPGTHERVRTGHVTCEARARERVVWVGLHRFQNGFVVCRWWLPKGVERHRLIGTIRVSAGGKQTARWFSRVVR
jgi:uncharacterized protein YkwD